jgi:hypothetical protein
MAVSDSEEGVMAEERRRRREGGKQAGRGCLRREKESFLIHSRERKRERERGNGAELAAVIASRAPSRHFRANPDRAGGLR